MKMVYSGLESLLYDDICANTFIPNKNNVDQDNDDISINTTNSVFRGSKQNVIQMKQDVDLATMTSALILTPTPDLPASNYDNILNYM